MFQSWIELANEVNIAKVLVNLGVTVSEAIFEGGNKKIYCPFGFYHSDGGTTKAMRIYLPTNTCYCFSCMKRYSPVSLVAASRDCTWENAALHILDEFNIKPKTVQQRWNEITHLDKAAPDVIALADALKVYCSGIDPAWETTQLDGAAAETLNKCLQLLEFVKTDEAAMKWLTACKQTMNRILNVMPTINT